MLSIRRIALTPALVLFVTATLVPIPSTAGPADRNLSCVGLDPPSDGEMTAGFAPGPGYDGHWGVDYAGDTDGYAQAAAPGVVTFAGSVAGNLVVSVDHGGGLKTSYSYLAGIMVPAGRRVARGELVGRIRPTLFHDDLHFSVRVDGEYIDPEDVLGCLPRSPGQALRLVPVGRSRIGGM